MDPYPGDPFDDGRDAPPFPGAVRAAGILWLGFGLVGFTTALLGMVVQAGQAAQARAAGGNPPPAGGGCCGLVIPLAFAWVGWQTINGTAKGTRANAAGSLGLAGVYLLLAGVGVAAGAGLLFAGDDGRPGVDPVLAFVLAGFALLVAGVLLAAGLLALPLHRVRRDDPPGQRQGGNAGGGRRHLVRP